MEGGKFQGDSRNKSVMSPDDDLLSLKRGDALWKEK